MSALEDSMSILAIQLSRATVRLNRRLRTEQETAVSLPQISVLTALALYGPMTPGALAQHERVKPPSMTRVLGLLETAGMIERAKHPTDGRQIMVSIAVRGMAVLEDEGSKREEWLRVQIGRLTPTQQKTLRAASEIMLEMADI